MMQASSTTRVSSLSTTDARYITVDAARTENNKNSILIPSSPKRREEDNNEHEEEEQKQHVQQSHTVALVKSTIRQQNEEFINEKENELLHNESLKPPPECQHYSSFATKYNYIRSWWPSSSSSYSFVPSSSVRSSSSLDHQQQIDHNSDEQHWISILLFCSSIILLFADQNLMAPNLTEISKEFDFTEIERDKKLGGDIALAFYFIGAPVAILIGCLTDSIHINRIRLLSITICMGETSCILTYFITTYPQLYVCRSLTGISIAGSLPIIYSLIGDMFRSKNRSTICAIMFVGTGFGRSFGQGIAGYIGPNYGWRIPFLIIGIPSLINAILIYFVVNDPKRGCKEEATIQYDNNMQQQQRQQQASPTFFTNNKTTPTTSSEDTTERDYGGIDITRSDPVITEEKMQKNDNHGQEESSMTIDDYDMSSNPWTKISSYSANSFQAIIHLLSIKSIFLGMIQGLPGCIPFGIRDIFLNDYLSENRNYTIKDATTIMLCFNFGHAVGFIIGAKIGEYLYSIEKRYAQLFSGFTIMISCIPFWILLNYVDANETPYWYVCSIASICGFCSGPIGPIIKSTIVNVTVPTYRGQAFALCILFDDLGSGLGPFFLSLLIIHFNGNRLHAFNIGVCGWIICGILNALLYFTVEIDEHNVQQYQYNQLRLLNERHQQQQYRDEEVGDRSYAKSKFLIANDDDSEDEEIVVIDEGIYHHNNNSNNVTSHIIRRHHHNPTYTNDSSVPSPPDSSNNNSMLEMTNTNKTNPTNNMANNNAIVKRSIS